MSETEFVDDAEASARVALEQMEVELTSLRKENAWLRGLVRDAYNEGWSDAAIGETGNNWEISDACALLNSFGSKNKS